MSTPLARQDAQRQATGQKWRAWTPEQWKEWKLDHPGSGTWDDGRRAAGMLQLEGAAQAPTTVAVIQDGAQDQTAVAA